MIINPPKSSIIPVPPSGGTSSIFAGRLRPSERGDEGCHGGKARTDVWVKLNCLFCGRQRQERSDFIIFPIPVGWDLPGVAWPPSERPTTGRDKFNFYLLDRFIFWTQVDDKFLFSWLLDLLPGEVAMELVCVWVHRKIGRLTGGKTLRQCHWIGACLLDLRLCMLP